MPANPSKQDIVLLITVIVRLIFIILLVKYAKIALHAYYDHVIETCILIYAISMNICSTSTIRCFVDPYLLVNVVVNLLSQLGLLGYLFFSDVLVAAADCDDYLLRAIQLFYSLLLGCDRKSFDF